MSIVRVHAFVLSELIALSDGNLVEQQRGGVTVSSSGLYAH